MASKIRLDAFQKKFVSSLAAEWRQTELWPLRVGLQVRLSKDKPRRDIDQVLGKLDRKLWESRTWGDLDSQRIMLTPAGLELADGGRADVQPLLALVRLAASRRIKDPYKPAKVSTADLVQILGPQRVGDLRRIQPYCEEFFPGTGGSTNPDGTIDRYAGFDIIRLEKATSAGELSALRNPQPRILTLKELEQPHIAVLKAIYKQMRKDKSYPRFIEFVLKHRAAGDILTLLHELPIDVLDQFALNNPRNDDSLAQSRLKLRFMGYVLSARNAEPALFARTLPILRAHYEKEPGVAPPMTPSMLAEQLHVPLERILDLQDLFEGEGYAGIQLVHAEDSWAIATRSQILAWRVKGLDSYLKRREQEVAKTLDDIAGERWDELNPGRRRRTQHSPLGTEPKAGPSVTFDQALRSRNLGAVRAEYERGLRYIVTDPPAAITAACALLESLFKSYIAQEGLDPPTDLTLNPLWRVVKENLPFDPDVDADKDLKRMLGSLSGLVDSIAILRTHASSAHGRDSSHRKMEEHEAMLALNASFSVATFILQVRDARTSLVLDEPKQDPI